MMANKTIRKVYGSGPTHISVDNFAERIYDVSSRVADRCNVGKAEEDATRIRRHLVVRGYKLDHEVQAFLSILDSGAASDEARPKTKWGAKSHWKLPLSVTFWLLVVLGSKLVRPLHLDDSATLTRLRSVITKQPDLDRLLQVVSGELTYKEYRDGAMVKSEYLKSLMGAIISEADAVLTTPGSISDEYAAFWEQAKGIAVDEAGFMNRADLYTVWGNTLRPCVLAGDVKQFSPTVMELTEKDFDGNYLNRFGEDGKISALAFLQVSGFPVYRLKTQLRMCRGMFDPAFDLVYSDLGEIQYGANCELSNPSFAVGIALEMWIQDRFPNLIKPPAAGTLTPVWMDTRGTFCWTDPVTLSRKNAKQCDLALHLLQDFVQAARVDVSSTVIIAPYKLNVDYINTRLSRGRYPALSKMKEAATVDSYQGKEGDIVFLVLGTTQRSGPGFTADEHRLNVMITRQRCGLVIFGELSVVGKVGKKGSADRKAADQQAKKGRAVVGEDGELRFTKLRMLRELAVRLSDAGRVLEVQSSKVIAGQVEEIEAEASGA
jgi:hypothetical protein